MTAPEETSGHDYDCVSVPTAPHSNQSFSQGSLHHLSQLVFSSQPPPLPNQPPESPPPLERPAPLLINRNTLPGLRNRLDVMFSRVENTRIEELIERIETGDTWTVVNGTKRELLQSFNIDYMKLRNPDRVACRDAECEETIVDSSTMLRHWRQFHEPPHSSQRPSRRSQH